MSGEVSYHAVENSKLSKPDVMELLQYPIGVTLEADGRYRVFLGAYRFWYLRECLHWTKIPCYVYKVKRQIRDPRERRRREIHRRQQAAESPSFSFLSSSSNTRAASSFAFFAISRYFSSISS